MSNAVDLLASAMTARARAQEVFANNLANVNTDGYLRQRIAFADTLERARERIELVADADLSAGNIEPTSRAADVALPGNSFLVVSTPEGDRYARSGSLTVNSAGEVADRRGYTILGEGGPIGTGGAAFEVTDRGEVLVDGTPSGKLRIVDFAPGVELRAVGRGIYRASGAPRDLETPRVLPGHRQGSNVEVLTEMVSMIESFRLYEMGAKALRAYDEMTGRLISTAQQSVG